MNLIRRWRRVLLGLLILCARNGTVLPPWATMKRTSGQRLSVPVKIRFTIARVVSNTYSTTKGGARKPVCSGASQWVG